MPSFQNYVTSFSYFTSVIIAQYYANVNIDLRLALLDTKTMIVEIITEKRTTPGRDLFSYAVPPELESRIRVGSICQISFGKKILRGIASKILPEAKPEDFDFAVKPIISINEDISIPLPYLEVLNWISETYLCSLGEAVSLLLPPKITRPRKSVLKKTEILEKTTILNTEQLEAFEKLLGLLKSPKKPALLYGVTGSGKTEIYLKLALECLKMGKQIIVLVPEIMLTSQIVDKFQEVMPDGILLTHSGLSQSERFKVYQQFFRGEKSIMIGPRSALTVPSQNLGLIIIDEEQEEAYKQEKNPRYHAVDLAEKIAKENKALLILGSATPRIETYYKAMNGQFELLILKNRYQKLLLPPAKVVDLKNEIKYDNFSPLSTELRERITAVLAKKRQVILFLNRRGMSTFVSCRECGEVIKCLNCSIPMIHHLNQRSHFLSCHHCDYKREIPETCPACGSSKIKFFGAGVDKIVTEIVKYFPKARIKKVDATSLQNKGEYELLHQEIKAGKIDILVGTQILAKGLDIPTVDLVGIISADVGLHLPYFRAQEKTFQLITQVSGRSGRRDNSGETIIQTYWPESQAIQLASRHDFQGFYEEEIKERKDFCYPPFCHLVRVVSEDPKREVALKAIEEIAGHLREAKIDFIGPAPCFLERVNNRFRFHLIIKTKTLPDPKIREVYLKNPYLTWDVEPVDLL